MWRFSTSKEEKKPSDEIVLDPSRMPKHIGIIMDGNGRWAKERKLPRTMGHRAGVETINRIVKGANDLGIKYITLYAFSTENWNRPKDEVSALMKLLVEYMRKKLDDLNKNNVVVKTIGDISKLPEICVEVLDDAKEKTKNNTGLILNFALNYGGRAEIIRGIKQLVKDCEKGNMDIDNFTEKDFNDYLYTKGQPDPDIIIRPSGEQRLSNFLLWQCAYSEFWYSNIKWPDFTVDDLCRAIYDYQKRDRRFGGVK